MEYSVVYAEFIMNSGKDFDDKYDDLDELCDVVYEDAGDVIYDEIYEFWLEMRSATFGKDEEEINEVITDFKEDIEDLKDDLKKRQLLSSSGASTVFFRHKKFTKIFGTLY